MATGQRFCRHKRCQHAIRPDGLGGWVHVLHGYPCRDDAGVRLSTYAELELPPRPDWPPVNPGRIPPGTGT